MDSITQMGKKAKDLPKDSLWWTHRGKARTANTHTDAAVHLCPAAFRVKQVFLWGWTKQLSDPAFVSKGCAVVRPVPQPLLPTIPPNSCETGRLLTAKCSVRVLCLCGISRRNETPTPVTRKAEAEHLRLCFSPCILLPAFSFCQPQVQMACAEGIKRRIKSATYSLLLAPQALQPSHAVLLLQAYQPFHLKPQQPSFSRPGSKADFEKGQASTMIRGPLPGLQRSRQGGVCLMKKQHGLRLRALQ